VSEDALWKYVRELHEAVDRGNRGDAPQPYRKGTFLVSARAGDIEVTVKDIAEEDAVLIAAELRSYGVRTVIRGSTTCPHCGSRVPAQEFCTRCRVRLERDQRAPIDPDREE
jgi:hypothetical protein